MVDLAESGFPDLESFLNDDGFDTPKIKSKKFPEGKVYHVSSPDAETGLRLEALANMAAVAAVGGPVSGERVNSLVMNDGEERSFMQQVLGATYQEMLDDGVPWVTMQRLNQYAFAYFAVSPQAANKGVEQGIFAGKAQGPEGNRAERRAKAKKSSTGAKSAQPASGGGKNPKKQKA